MIHSARQPVTALVPCYNNADIIARCLDSVTWADEILLCDSFSTDKTLEIAQAYGARVIQQAYVNSALQKNWAIPQCRYEWVLQVDSDEALEEGLAEEILQTIELHGSEFDGFLIPFKHHILGQWVTVAGLYPEPHLRLFRRDAGRFETKEVHAHLSVPGKVGVLRHHILHYGMPHISKQLSNIDRYSRYQAEELRKRGKCFRWWHLLLRPPAIFCDQFVRKQGYRAGYRGLWLAALAATFDFWTYAKLWELEELGLERSPK